MNSFISMFEGETNTAPATGGFGLWIVLGVFLVLMVVMTVLPQRKQKKQAEEMMSRLCEGCTVTTIGGIVGTVVKFDENNIWLSTGTGENNTTMQFVRQAIHSISGGESDQTQQSQEESDEIK